jgi:hypothetical protein
MRIGIRLGSSLVLTAAGLLASAARGQDVIYSEFSGVPGAGRSITRYEQFGFGPNAYTRLYSRGMGPGPNVVTGTYERQGAAPRFGSFYGGLAGGSRTGLSPGQVYQGLGPGVAGRGATRYDTQVPVGPALPTQVPAGPFGFGVPALIQPTAPYSTTQTYQYGPGVTAAPAPAAAAPAQRVAPPAAVPPPPPPVPFEPTDVPPPPPVPFVPGG